MLLTFSVKNYKGIAEKQTFDLIASSGKEFPENLHRIDNNVSVNNIACLIGPNGSGKTHLLESIYIFSQVIRNSENIKDANAVFILDDEHQSLPTDFEVLLYNSEDEEYINYSFSIHKGKVVYEQLSTKQKRKNAKPHNIFKRDQDGIKFAKEYSSIEQLVSSTIGDSGLIVNFAPSLKNSPLLFVHDWAQFVLLLKPTHFESICASIFDQIFTYKEHSLGKDEETPDSQENFKRSILAPIKNSINALDIPLNDIDISISEDGKATLMLTPKSNASNNKPLTLREAEEFFSEGTFNTINMVISISLLLQNKGMILIDEFDGALHHKLSLGFLKTIKKILAKSSGSQMIMSTHDVLLLDNGFRRDSIFLLQKDQSSFTVITRASDFSVRKDSKISSKYLNDEFGALPNILLGE